MTKRRDYTPDEKSAMIDTCVAMLTEFDSMTQELVDLRPDVIKLQKLYNSDFRQIKKDLLHTEKRIHALRQNINELWKLNNE